MKFRTELNPKPRNNKINQHSVVLMLGSCFANEMAQRLQHVGVVTLSNPLGVLYNPLSIAQILERVAECRTIQSGELECRGDMWFSFDTHGLFDNLDPQQVVASTESAIRDANDLFGRCDELIVTLGTAWVWEHNGRVVANCHKLPAREFQHRLLELEECVEALRRIVNLAGGRRVIFTISPVRYLNEGLENNGLSKALLRVAVERILRENEKVDYFPAYELLVDDLRDYRFYGEDMVHPSKMAVEYVWERFAESFLSREALAEGESFARLADGLMHRPLHPESEEYGSFCRKMLKGAVALSQRLPQNTIAKRLVEEYSSRLR